MESAATKYQKLVTMMEAFVSGQSRSRDFVNQMEGFATSDLDDEDDYVGHVLIVGAVGGLLSKDF